MYVDRKDVFLNMSPDLYVSANLIQNMINYSARFEVCSSVHVGGDQMTT